MRACFRVTRQLILPSTFPKAIPGRERIITSRLGGQTVEGRIRERKRLLPAKVMAAHLRDCSSAARKRASAAEEMLHAVSRFRPLTPRDIAHVDEIRCGVPADFQTPQNAEFNCGSTSMKRHLLLPLDRLLLATKQRPLQGSRTLIRINVPSCGAAPQTRR